MFPGENRFRAYIGFVWFYARAADDAAAAAALQRGVDAVVAQTPALSGRLRETGAGDGHLAVDYADPPRAVAVEQRRAACSFAELAAGDFAQHGRESAAVFAGLPSATPQVDGQPVLVVQAVALSDGGLAVAILCHHVLMDGAGTFAVAERIARAARGEQLHPDGPLWVDRQPVRRLLRQHVSQAAAAAASEVAVGAEPGTTPLAVRGELRQRQIWIARTGLEALRRDCDCSTTPAVLALLWRAWARALEAHGSRSAEFYVGGPVDMRAHVDEGALRGYLGNFIQALPMAAPRAALLDAALPAVAARVRSGFSQLSTLAGVRALLDATFDDPSPRLAGSDSPLLAFSSIAHLPFHSLDFGFARADVVRMRALDSPNMVFAFSDAAGGIRANFFLPQSLFDALAADPELARYARLS
ncbi:hypothetical protein IWQ57_001909 [Coemansia nantahalensis]|uniref:Uncharacterized protein n=1 Tax=Coemansia nantahalensis TaxID=2789366 RepID=A0ACC1K2T3_9FUNG|nr:hypothetical protein IWQ57_001909 [Coemansia nantahalensis]